MLPLDNKFWQRNAQPAFTLLELLVVVAIIDILAALLLPSLAKAKEKGRQSHCINSVRQQSMAILMYADERDHPPATAADATRASWTVTANIWF